MHTQRMAPATQFYHRNVPVIDRDFDRFEMNNDLAANLHEAEKSTFYHDAPNRQE